MEYPFKTNGVYASFIPENEMNYKSNKLNRIVGVAFGKKDNPVYGLIRFKISSNKTILVDRGFVEGELFSIVDHFRNGSFLHEFVATDFNDYSLNFSTLKTKPKTGAAYTDYFYDDHKYIVYFSSSEVLRINFHNNETGKELTKTYRFIPWV